jgi:hypothetical protein
VEPNNKKINAQKRMGACSKNMRVRLKEILMAKLRTI